MRARRPRSRADDLRRGRGELGGRTRSAGLPSDVINHFLTENKNYKLGNTARLNYLSLAVAPAAAEERAQPSFWKSVYASTKIRHDLVDSAVAVDPLDLDEHRLERVLRHPKIRCETGVHCRCTPSSSGSSSPPPGRLGVASRSCILP